MLWTYLGLLKFKYFHLIFGSRDDNIIPVWGGEYRWQDLSSSSMYFPRQAGEVQLYILITETEDLITELSYLEAFWALTVLPTAMVFNRQSVDQVWATINFLPAPEIV